MSVLCTACIQWPCKPEDNIRFLQTGLAKGCEPPHGCWGSDPVLLEAQPVLLTTELSLRPLNHMLNKTTVAGMLATDYSEATVKKRGQTFPGRCHDGPE